MAAVLQLSAKLGWEFWIVRALFVGGTSALCYNFEPFGLHPVLAAGLGFAMSFAILFAELRLRRATTPDFWEERLAPSWEFSWRSRSP
jgi:hypothetical protein